MAIGDVKYSILDPQNFRKANGNGWIPLDGGLWAKKNKIDLINTDLNLQFGIAHIPDARAMFIRVCNMGRNDQFKDPNGDRDIGSHQSDALQSHHHTYTNAARGHDKLGNYNRHGGEGTLNENTGSTGESETRPNNIVLYAYVHITDESAS